MIEKTGIDWVQGGEKRLTDIAIAGALVPIAVPMMAVAAGTIALVDRVNPLFMQERVASDETTVQMPKLRTLRHVHETIPAYRGYDDPRASKVGRFLRQSHIDEFPQGFLVLRGVMSIVGPRLMVPSDYEATLDSLSPHEQYDWLAARRQCKPGGAMSYGIDQHRADRQAYSLHDRALMDIEYAHTASRRLDLKIIAMSFIASKADLLGINAESQPGHLQSIKALTNVAEKFGVAVAPDDMAYWRAVLNVGRAFDDAVDGEGSTNLEPLLYDLIRGRPVSGVAAEEAQEFQTVFLRQNEKKQAAILRGTALAEYARRLREATTLKEFVRLRTEEACLFAGIVALPETDGRHDYEERVKFNAWLRKFMSICYLLDSFIDFKDDYRSQTIAIIPSAPTYMNLGVKVLQEAPSVFRGLPLSAYPGMALSGINKAIRHYGKLEAAKLKPSNIR